MSFLPWHSRRDLFQCLCALTRNLTVITTFGLSALSFSSGKDLVSTRFPNFLLTKWWTAFLCSLFVSGLKVNLEFSFFASKYLKKSNASSSDTKWQSSLYSRFGLTTISLFFPTVIKKGNEFLWFILGCSPEELYRCNIAGNFVHICLLRGQRALNRETLLRYKTTLWVNQRICKELN